MKRNLRAAALLLLSLGLASCDATPPDQKTGSAAPVIPPAPPAQPAEAAGTSPPQVKQDADMMLSSKVKAAVQKRATSHIEVAASDGVVRLYGTVDAPEDKQRFALAAMDVEGVRSVVNNLVVLRGS